MKLIYELKTKKNTIRIMKSNNDHYTLVCFGDINRVYYKKQTLTAIRGHYSKSDFKVIAYHAFYFIREGKLDQLDLNHAEVFGSCWV